MKMISHTGSRILLLLAALSLVTSCGDQELERENEELGQKIEQLERDLKALQTIVDETPEDQAGRLIQANKDLKEARDMVSMLAAKDDALREKHSALKMQYQQYREKYPMDTATPSQAPKGSDLLNKLRKK